MKLYEGYYWPDDDVGCHESAVKTGRELKETWLPHVKGRRVAVQAGGNCGVYPLVLSMHFDQVYTFEPEANNFGCLMLNCSGVENIQAYCAALGDHSRRRVGLQVNAHNAGSHHITAGDTIPVWAVDDLKLDACDLLALDVEGYEYLCLKGAERTVEAFHPTVIIEMKKHGERYGIRKEMIRDWLTERGYTYRALVGRDEIWS